ncbi:Hypothetical predicted protein [Lecanosticta acicola]|uniref:Clr5 domain-containing protein n=1 Tax=Lecanosticta acicola TaxID=111012 RepID=A0AAI8W1T4_9PEZI|nr:Hypothetical predicted protein [Lecanosticta acicola]
MDDDATSKKRVGRPPKYDWDDKRDICYKLWVDEHKSAAQIAAYFAERFNVHPSELPCRKGFHRQFQIWGFPSHKRTMTPEDEAVVMARVKELWEQNVNQKDIKSTLAEEGWALKHYDFQKLWRSHGLRLRNDQGFRVPEPEKNRKKRKRSSVPAEGVDRPQETQGTQASRETQEAREDENSMSAPPGPEEAAQRAQRLFEIQLESDQKLQSRKRRRRIRGYGHLPPDAPGTAPRYASETSLDESKAFLHLSNEMYQAVRKDYETICREMGVIKKTECPDGVWEESQRRLVRENMHLSAMMHPLQPDQDKKKVALECLCADVTKRMRTANKAITIAEANNILGLNPTESKTVRRSLYEILEASRFESRLVSGDDHWRELRQRWFDTNQKLQQAAIENDARKMQAVDLLCKDAMKRFREDRNKRGERPVVQRNTYYGPGPGPAWAAVQPRSKTGLEEKAARQAATQTREPLVQERVQHYPPSESGNIIAALAQATGNVDFDLDPALSGPTPFTAQAESPPLGNPIAVYFRLGPTSTVVGNHPKMWLGKLTSVSMTAFNKAATSKAGAASVTRVHGLVKSNDGTEDKWIIENQDELQAYLVEAGEKPSFLVQLEGGYA